MGQSVTSMAQLVWQKKILARLDLRRLFSTFPLSIYQLGFSDCTLLIKTTSKNNKDCL